MAEKNTTEKKSGTIFESQLHKALKTPEVDTHAHTHTREGELLIIEDRHNYRKHSEKNLSLIGKSLDEFGAGRSIVADNTGSVIGGNGTLRAANQRGIPKRIIHTNGEELVVVVRDDISPDDPRRAKLAIMDNSTTDSSEFDMDLLQLDFEPLELGNLGVELPDIEDVLRADVVEDFSLQAPDTAKSVRGEVYQLGDHRLMCGDGTDADAITACIGGGVANLWITDPPYNVDYEGKTAAALKIKNDKMDDETFLAFLRSA